MPERLTEAEVAAIRERWEATERRIVQREAAAKRTGAMGDQERIRRPEGHEDIPRLLATLEAERARAAALVEALRSFIGSAGDVVDYGEHVHDCRFRLRDEFCDCGRETFLQGYARAKEALTRGGDDERA